MRRRDPSTFFFRQLEGKKPVGGDHVVAVLSEGLVVFFNRIRLLTGHDIESAWRRARRLSMNSSVCQAQELKKRKEEKEKEEGGRNKSKTNFYYYFCLFYFILFLFLFLVDICLSLPS